MQCYSMNKISQVARALSKIAMATYNKNLCGGAAFVNKLQRAFQNAFIFRGPNKFFFYRLICYAMFLENVMI